MLLLSAFAPGARAQPLSVVPPIPYAERTLPNGLEVITSLDRTTPNVSIQVWYRVGGKDDPPGRSGFAHLFEHMMFKATRDMPPEFMDRLTEDVGGMNNAFTEDDTTAFYEVVPASSLQRVLWAESERMSALVVDKANFASERQVVEEELRQRVLANPYGRLYEYLIPEHTFEVHPYRRPPIGSIGDLDAASLDDVQRFHATYYRPDNAVLVVAGNFDPAQLQAFVDQYFGPLAHPAAPIPRITVKEPPRQGPASFTGYGPDVPLPAVALTWLAPAAASPDAPALTVLDAILTTGKSSRLYDSLVYRRQLAQQVFSTVDLRAQLGLDYVGAIAASGRSLAEVEAALRSEIADLRTRPVSPETLETARTQLLTAEIRQRETLDGRANELGAAAVIEGDPARADADIAALQAVSAADVQRVAQTWLGDERSVVIRYLPLSAAPKGQPPAPPEPPPPPSKPFLGQVAALLPEGERAPPPPMGAQPPAALPTPVERTLSNGLRVIVAKSTDIPIVAASLAFTDGASADPPGDAGLARLTASVATDGTRSASAREIAARSEALGATLAGGADIDDSSLGFSVMPAKLPDTLAILADVAENPVFTADELERARKAALEDLDVGYGDPSQVGELAASALAYAGSPAAHAPGGGPDSLKRLGRVDLTAFHDRYWRPDNAVLVLAGDISPDDGFALAEKVFGAWPTPAAPPAAAAPAEAASPARQVAIDLPGAGQADVVVVRPGVRRSDPGYFAALVANAVLGGGYSARLNEEVRVKRGLSYGAGSDLAANRDQGAILAAASTRNDAADEVAGLMLSTMSSLVTAPPQADELAARKAALVGDFGRGVGTAEGLAGELESLAVAGVDIKEIRDYPVRVEAVTSEAVEVAARRLLAGGDPGLIVVGDSKAFVGRLKARYPGIETIPIADFDPGQPSLVGTSPKP